MKNGLALTVLFILVGILGCSESKPDSQGSQEAPVAATDAATSTLDGQAVYDARCASCHRLGAYDQTGEERDLAGRKRMSAKFVERHTAASISDQDLANLRAFLSAK